jgi:molybdopterin-containing oxidoreductase family membrane subunit
MAAFGDFILACGGTMLRGSRLYYGLLGALVLGVGAGAIAYAKQLEHGLIVTGMGDQVTWGVYIANFTFLVGLAAAAVMVVIPSYIFHDAEAKRIVLIAECMAVAACLSALTFVVVDLGRPDRMLNVVPLLSRLNFPRSLLAWDVIVVPGYLLLNLLVPGYVLYRSFRGLTPRRRVVFPVILLSIVWALALHIVTAFLYVSDVARPFWHSTLLGPRFLASAFASGPALLLGVLHVLDATSGLDLEAEARRLLANITTAALQVNLIMLGAELFTELYRTTEHSLSAEYLFLGLGEANALVPWIRTAIALEVVAVLILMIEPLQRRTGPLLLACACTVVGIWIEKGMGLVIPGFIPSPLGEIVEYQPTSVETVVSLGVWCLGALAFVLLVRPVLALNEGTLKQGA